MISYWTNACLQVARTYVHRVRFWITGGVYLFIALTPNKPDAANVVLSAIIATILASFVALHLRRQFGGPAAKIVPHFAIPHLAVGAAISLGIWVIVPSIQAWRMGLPAWGPIGTHAVAGLLLAAVVCWRHALLLLVSLPLLLFATRSSLHFFNPQSAYYRFPAGELPGQSMAMVLVALIAQAIAAVFLLRMSDRQLTVSDDFAVEMPPADSASGRWNEWWYGLRDTAAGYYLADVGRGWWRLNRWRVPVAASWVQMAIVALVGLALSGLTWFASGRVEGALIGAEIVAFGMLFIPLNAWHMRRGAMALEFTRPVTRGRFFVEIALALAVDLAAWTVLASALSCLVVYLVLRHEPEPWSVVGIQLGFLWVLAILAYGLGLATFRLRYWLPLMVLASLAWVWLTTAGLVLYRLSQGGLPGNFPAYWFAGSAVLTSGLLTLLTLLRWLRADVA
jgi:hypothetical protein